MTLTQILCVCGWLIMISFFEVIFFLMRSFSRLNLRCWCSGLEPHLMPWQPGFKQAVLDSCLKSRVGLPEATQPHKSHTGLWPQHNVKIDTNYKGLTNEIALFLNISSN